MGVSLPVAGSTRKITTLAEFLVRREKISAGRIEREVSRRFSLRRNVLHRRKRSGVRVHGEHANAIVAAIRTVDEAACAVHLNLGGRAVPRKTLGQGGNALQFLQRAGIRVVSKGSQHRSHFAD